MKPNSRRQSSDHPADVRNLARFAAEVQDDIAQLNLRRGFPWPGLRLTYVAAIACLFTFCTGHFSADGLVASFVVLWLCYTFTRARADNGDGTETALRVSTSAHRRFQAAANHLCAALEGMSARDAGRCPSETVAALDDILRGAADKRLSNYSPRLALSILSAMEHLATTGEMSTLEWIEQSAGADSPAQRMRAAARQTIAAVHARTERERLGETLLRAAAPADTDTLLRPAHGDTDTDPGLLLRPARDEERPVR